MTADELAAWAKSRGWEVDAVGDTEVSAHREAKRIRWKWDGKVWVVANPRRQ